MWDWTRRIGQWFGPGGSPDHDVAGPLPEIGEEHAVKLVVGLGNPGRKYQDTRHNVGYEVLAEIARRSAAGPVRAKFHGELVQWPTAAGKVLLLSPTTYMNRSGQSVLAASDFYKLNPEDILVVCDDFHLPLGRLRFRPRGSSGGHNGLEDIIRRIGNDQFPRLRIGIGTPPPQWAVADYVLSRFADEDQDTIQSAIRRAADGVADWIDHGIQYCMNQYNGA